MSEMAKKARAALKEKAKRLGSDRPVQKVDSSTFVPPELLEADVKTGLRPLSRRAYKSGGKVEGACGPTRADRKPRKSGGEATAYANAKVNRNVKDANELREGKKHVGGMKKGGRAGYKTDGKVESDQPVRAETLNKMTNREYRERLETPSRRTMEIKPTDPQPSDLYDKDQLERLERGYKKGGRAARADGGKAPLLSPFGEKQRRLAELKKQMLKANPRTTSSGDWGDMLAERSRLESDIAEGSKKMQGRASGGRTKKMDGGLAGDPRTAGNAILQNSAAAAGVPQDRLGFAPNMPSQGVKRFLGLKKGGEAKHPDEAMDKALIKKMVKKEARTGKADGGDAIMGKRTDKPENVYKPEYNEQAVDKAIDSSNRAGRKIRGKEAMMIKSLLKGRTGRATGGGTFSGPGYPEKVPGVVPGGRMARKDGGRAKKGKTNINIVIQAGKPDTGGMDVKNPMLAGPVPPPPAPPIMPPPGGPAGGPPPGMPPMPPGGAPGMPPMMGRKAGGRVYRSYKDMDAGAGSGLGRLEKTEIASRSNRKAGGKVYRSYKDMDAGAGSGLGRLEKTEIQRRK